MLNKLMQNMPSSMPKLGGMKKGNGNFAHLASTLVQWKGRSLFGGGNNSTNLESGDPIE